MSKCVKCGNEILTGDIHWEMGLCNNCYNELYKDHKTHISLDKMWLKLAQDFRDENEKLQDKVANLEAKLAESEGAYRDINRAFTEQRELWKHQLAEKDLAIENWQTIYESVVQTCHNDKEEIERLNKKLETQENIITNLVEDNRASQEWYRKQLEEKDKEIEKLKKQVKEKDLLYKSLLAMATQLNDVYDTEGCMYGDEISGDTPEETANAYIEETKKHLKEKNNEKNNS